MNATKKAKTLLEEKKVITIWELIGIISLFLVILYILFPKGTLEKYLLAETKNYDLAIKYLETLTKAYPDLKEFKLALLKFYIKKGDLEKATYLLDKLESEKIYQNNIQFIKTAYNLYKNLYFKTKDKTYLSKAKSYLEKLLQISNLPLIYEFTYKESTELNLPELRLKTLKMLSKKQPSKEYLNELLNLSIYLKDYETALETIDKLYKIDKSNLWLEKKAEIYLYVKKDIHKAVDIYLKLFNTQKNKKLQTKYFLKAFYLLIWNKKYNSALKLAREYENYFLYKRNKTVLKRILKFYLETGKLNYARELSLKILKMEERI